MFIAFLKSVYRMNLVAEDLGWVGLILILAIPLHTRIHAVFTCGFQDAIGEVRYGL